METDSAAEYRPSKMLLNSASLPPYVSFSAFAAFLAVCSSVGVPARIGRATFSNVSENVGRQLATAFKALGLTDGAGHPTQRLRLLTEAYAKEDWPQALRTVLAEVYPEVMALPLARLSSQEVRKEFHTRFGLPEEMQRKVMSFFLTAAREAGVQLSRDVISRLKPRGVAVLKSDSIAVVAASVTPPRAPERKFNAIELLWEIYDPVAMTKNEEQAIFTLMRFVKRRTRP